jgi:AraC family transcriptional regulator
MRALDETIAALGKPVFVRTLGVMPASRASIGRWRHEATVVDVYPSDAVRLTVSLMDSPNAQNRRGPNPPEYNLQASVSVFSPKEGATIDVKGKADVVQLFFAEESFHTMLGAPFSCPSMYNLQDDAVRSILMRMLVASARRTPDDGLAIEHALHQLALRLEGHARSWETPSDTPAILFRGGLAPTVFRRIDEMIAATLDGSRTLSLAEMATAAGLSVTHFTRAFRRHTGNTPHNYIVRRRMQRAVSILRDSRISVAETADAVGFSTPAHFVATFRNAMGVTPAALRDAL